MTDCFADTLKAHGVTGSGYAICTDTINLGVLGKTAKELRVERSVKITRDGMTKAEIAALNLAEVLSSDDIEEADAYGTDECRRHCADAAKRVRRVFE